MTNGTAFVQKNNSWNSMKSTSPRSPTPHDVYSSEDVVAAYANADYLEAAEKNLIESLGSGLRNMSMLDLCVGGGRTTQYFAPLVQRYVGVDFSRGMIDQCIQKFGRTLTNATFVVADVRNLECLAGDRFDLVLISYNSIAPLDHHDRLKVFENVRDLCKPGAYFLFSTHNLHCLPRLFGIPALFSGLSLLHPKKSYWHLRAWVFRRFVYDTVLSYRSWMRSPYVMVNDGAEKGRLRHYYVDPSEQVSQLRSFFEDVKVIRYQGSELTLDGRRKLVDDPWLFYLCRAAP